MLRTFLLLAFIFSPMNKGIVSGESKFTIYSSDGKKQANNTYIAHNFNDTLILDCKIKQQFYNESTKPLWILPEESRPHLVKDHGKSLRLIVEHLQETDAGPYKCVDSNEDNEESASFINLFIKGSLECWKGIVCNNRCIHERFICDGFPDCKNEKDESSSLCGLDPCHDKIKCANGRCIPRSWCCNSNNGNCTKKWDITCCPKVATRGSLQYDYNAVPDPFYNADVVFREYGDRPLNYLNNPQHYTDLNFLQTTVYAVFGCAIFFMLVVTILVVVMQCKFQMRRNWLLNRQRIFGNNTYHRAMSQEVDIMSMIVHRFTQGNSSNCSQQQQQSNHRRNAGDLLVTYNINNGVQIVGKPVEPPPYSEIAPSPPLDQGPPPPYRPATVEVGDGAAEEVSDLKPEGEERCEAPRVQASSEPNLTNIG